MGARVPIAVALFLVSTSASGSPFGQVKDCRDLKAAIEGHTSAAAGRGSGGGGDRGTVVDLTLHLHGDVPYVCEESVLIAEAQSVVLVGCRDGFSNVHVTPTSDSGGATTRSLFVNEGTLRLENIRFHLDSRGEDVPYGKIGGDGGAAAAIAGESKIALQYKEGEKSGACAGAVRVVRNSGHVAVQDVRVVDASFDGGWRPERRCEEIAQGRVVYSDRGERRDGSGSTGRSVVVSHSNFGLADDELGAAFHADGGNLAVESSRFERRTSQLWRGEESERFAGLESPAAVPVFVAFGGNVLVTNTVFVGFGIGGERGRGAIVFKESDGAEGGHRLLMFDVSFLGGNGDQLDDGGTTSTAAIAVANFGSDVGEFDAATQLRQQRSIRRLKSCSGIMCLDQGLLLVIISVGLFVILMGMCCLDNWLRLHPDWFDRWLPRRFQSTRTRRVQHDHNADKSPASRNNGVDLGDLEAPRVEAAFTKPIVVTSSETASTAHGVGSFRASTTQLHADQYSIYDGTCDEEVSFVVPQTFKHVLAKPQANVRSSLSRESGFMIDVSLDDDTATITTTESRSSSNGSTVAAADAKRLAYLGTGIYMDDMSPSSPATSSGTASGAATGEGGRIQLDRSIREDSLSPDSLEGVETGGTPCGSVSTATDMYESGCRAPVRSPRPEDNIQAFASVSSLRPGALERSPVIEKDSSPRLEIATGDIWEETKAESDGEDSLMAADETEGRSMFDAQRDGSSPSTGSSCISTHGHPVPGRDYVLAKEGGSVASTVFDDQGRSSPVSIEVSTTAPVGGSIIATGITLKSAPFSPLQSPTESSFSGLSMGALSRMLQMMHGGEAIPAVQHGRQRMVDAAIAAQPPISSQHDVDMCYSPDSDGDREVVGTGFHSNNPMLLGQWPRTEEELDSLTTPAVAAADRPAATSATAPACCTRYPCSDGPKDDDIGPCHSCRSAGSPTNNGGVHSARPSCLSCCSEPAASPKRNAVERVRSATSNPAPFHGGPPQDTKTSISALEPMDYEDDGMYYSSPSADGDDERRHDDGMCYSSPSTDGSDERRDEDDRRMFAVSPAFSTPGRCIIGVCPDDKDGHLHSQFQPSDAYDMSAPQPRDGCAPASTPAENGKASCPTNGFGLRVSTSAHGVPRSLPANNTAGDSGGAGVVSSVARSACVELSPLTSSYSLYCSPPSTAGGPSPEGTPGGRAEGSANVAITDRPQSTTVDALERLSPA